VGIGAVGNHHLQGFMSRIVDQDGADQIGGDFFRRTFRDVQDKLREAISLLKLRDCRAR
jgi:hypothetical protein